MPPIIPGTSASRAVNVTACLPATLSSHTRSAITNAAATWLANFVLAGGNDVVLGANTSMDDALRAYIAATTVSTLYRIDDCSGAIIWPFGDIASGGSGLIGLRLWNYVKYGIVREVSATGAPTVAQMNQDGETLAWTCYPLYAGKYTISSAQTGVANGVVLATEAYAANVIALADRGYPNQVQLIGPQSSGVISADTGKAGIKIDCIGHRYLEVMCAGDSTTTPLAKAGALVQMLSGA